MADGSDGTGGTDGPHRRHARRDRHDRREPSGAGSAVRVTVIGKPGCHLCDTAREVVASVTAELGVGWRELSILDDEGLHERYWEQIPVVLVDGEPFDYWRVDERRLRQALTGRRGWFRRR